MFNPLYSRTQLIKLADPLIDPTEAHNTIQDVLQELQARVNGFNFPGRLDFEESPGDGQVPKLADTKWNSAVNEHKRKLDALLETLQGVKARGDGAVKKAKADAIRKVKAEVEELKRMKAVVWYNVSGR
ncbi:hypothetical protein CTheo_3833 [Ceratobasidium theobromae]|uniref:Uncharacterized protein n=1 Tax=Ceratobasidium theobromae TaxID=1582974 RepID=A0A5N5QLW5_9AGAM|nr:hypothetical protein CTheo_3833 [Ceratobasidium theobromae]